MFGNGGGAQSGVESMLRTMGLGAVLDAAKVLAESGAVEKIIAFADDMEGLRNDLAAIRAKLSIAEPEIIEGTAIEFRGAEIEPDGNSGARGSGRK